MLSFDSIKINNKNPFLDFVKSLIDEEQADIFAAIDKLLELKNNNQRIPEKLSKYISNGIFELRVRHINRISRCLYFYGKENKIIFSNGFIKKQQKTPINEIERANKFKTYYFEGG
ncbi:MAG: type II toxin-antitoxin system RelE/ParE family toxin [FCB group bacterium]|jgi:phage-related protein